MLGSSRTLFVTGAGVSRDSGLPTYRGDGGLYTDGADGSGGDTIMASLTATALACDPCTTWTHLAHVGRRMALGKPNRGHAAIAEIQRVLRDTAAEHSPAADELPPPAKLCARPLEWTAERAVVVTQNIDGFHCRAGTRDVVEIHGNAGRFRCGDCGAPAGSTGLPSEHVKCAATGWASYAADFTDRANIPRCGRCGGVVRPDVVLFGEMLPEVPRERLLSVKADVCVMVGSSAQFPYIADPFFDTSFRGGLTVDLNPTDDADAELGPWTVQRMRVPASEGLVAIYEELCALAGVAPRAVDAA